MYPETPYVAKIVDELEQRDLISAGADASDETSHAAFFLLREVCGFSLPFAFKGALMPFSVGLENVLGDVQTSRPLVERLNADIVLRQEDEQAIERLEQISTPPDGFDGGRRRWQTLVAAYLFLAGSPMYLDGFSGQRSDDFRRFYGRLFSGSEVGQVVGYVKQEHLEPAPH